MSRSNYHRFRNAGFAKGFGALVFLYLFFLGTYNFWLPWFGEFLIINTPLKQCDLIVVSTGSYSRVRYAIKLMEKSYAGKMLLLGDTRYKITGKTTLELAEQEALKEGIARENLFVKHSTSTRDDARLAKETMALNGFKSALVVSDKYNMRRLAMVFDRVFQRTSLDLGYVYAGQEKIGKDARDRWWETPYAFIYVMKEWIKFPVNYYLLLFGNVR